MLLLLEFDCHPRFNKVSQFLGIPICQANAAVAW